MHVGFIGLGRMGLAMADVLLDDGHAVTVFNRTRAKCEPLAARGAVVADSVSALTQASEIVITMLADDAALSQVVHGDGGLLAALPDGGVHVTTGTHSADLVRAMGTAHADAGCYLIAAPMLGRPEAVAARTASLVAAGAPVAMARARPALNSIAARVFEAGEAPEAAAIMKIANNFLLGCAIEAMGEAFALVRKWDGAPDIFQQLVSGGMFASPAYGTYAGLIARGAFEPAGFTALLGLKDADLALTAGDVAEVPLPSGVVWRNRLADAVARGHGEHDWSTMAREQALASGLPDIGAALR